MRRRDFIGLIGGAAAWPLAARAQQDARVRRIGVPMSFAESDPEIQARLAAFREGLQKLGWREGRNVQIDIRWAPDAESLLRSVKDLVALQPDVILSANTPATAALVQQTRTIPIVMASVGDPVGDGFVASFPRPGGNVTGFVSMEPTVSSKWLELLKEIAPRVARVAAVFNPPTAAGRGSYFLSSFMAAAPNFSVEVTAAPVHNVSELESFIVTHAREPNGGLVVTPDAFMVGHRAEIISLAARYRLPTVYPYRSFPEVGGLLSYGNDQIDNYRRAAIYVDRILRGIKASELPVQAPVKYEMVVNAKTAKALGLEMPSSFYWRADEIIE